MTSQNIKTGYAIITDPYAGSQESDTYNCAHCQFAVHVHFGSGIKRGYCPMCNAPLCGRATCNKECTPFMRKIEAQESRYRLHRALELGYDGG